MDVPTKKRVHKNKTKRKRYEDVSVHKKVGAVLARAGGDLQAISAQPSLNNDNEEEEPQNVFSIENLRVMNIRGTRYGTAAYVALGYGLCWSYIAFIMINANITYDYTQMRLPPSPGPFYSSRYGYQWGMYYLLVFNLVVPLTLGAGLSEPQYRSRLLMHKAFAIVLIFANVLVFSSLGGIWLFYCNNWYSFGSICDDPANCCNNYVSSWGANFCPVTAGCTYVTGNSQVMRWTPFFLAFLWSVFFGLYAFFSISMNNGLKSAISKYSDVDLLNKD